MISPYNESLLFPTSRETWWAKRKSANTAKCIVLFTLYFSITGVNSTESELNLNSSLQREALYAKEVL